MDDGGAAFPGIEGSEGRGNVTIHPAVGNPSQPEYVTHNQGMSLRDWFAGQAIHGYANSGSSRDLIAQEAYKLADAMMKERLVEKAMEAMGKMGGEHTT